MKKQISKENVIVYLQIHVDDKNYECVGVLISEDSYTLRLAFNARNDVVKDYVDIKKENILKIEYVNTNEVEIVS